jgi:cytochrome c oxidase subunit 2
VTAGNSTRRRACLLGAVTGLVAGAFFVACAGRVAKPGRPDTASHVVSVSAHKYEFSPASLRVRRGEPVTLRIASLDVVHGFSLPALGVRATLVPGQVAEVQIVPTEAGSFPFACDVFCGDGHEDMAGTLEVLP